MKKKCRLWFPVVVTCKDDLVVDIPDGVDENDWLLENRSKLIESHPLCTMEFSESEDAFETGHAGVIFTEFELIEIKS